MVGYTVEMLQEEGPQYVMGYLLPRVTSRTSITYGEIAERLRKDLEVSARIFPTHIGGVAGALQDLIHEIEPNAPLLNVLIVRADSEEAGTGVDSYLKSKFGLSQRINLATAQRSELLQKAAEEVYAFNHWDRIYRQAFGSRPPSADPSSDIEGTERDGQARGGPAESEEHKRLKAYVLAHPEVLGIKGALVAKKDEYLLLSGDEVDVFFDKGDEVWLVEVKSERSNDRDMVRGCYQSIKYRAVFEAQIKRTLPQTTVHAVLVTRTPLPAGSRAIADENRIRHIILSEWPTP